MNLKKMKNFKELSKIESIEIYGGELVDYYKISWSGTGNPFKFGTEVCINGAKSIANAGIWVWNQFCQ